MFVGIYRGIIVPRFLTCRIWSIHGSVCLLCFLYIYIYLLLYPPPQKKKNEKKERRHQGNRPVRQAREAFEDSHAAQLCEAFGAAAQACGPNAAGAVWGGGGRWMKLGMGQNQSTRRPRVLVHISICQGFILGTYF